MVKTPVVSDASAKVPRAQLGATSSLDPARHTLPVLHGRGLIVPRGQWKASGQIPEHCGRDWTSVSRLLP